MTIGAIARLTVETQGVLNDPLYHRVPNKMLAERLALEINGGKNQ